MSGQKRYYSLSVLANREIAMPAHLTILTDGLNVFNVTTDDIEGLKKALTDEGCRILRCHQLDDFEPVVENYGPIGGD